MRACRSRSQRNILFDLLSSVVGGSACEEVLLQYLRGGVAVRCYAVGGMLSEAA